MAFENLIIRNVNKINGITVDGILTESVNVEVRVTQNPIEEGADVSDNVVLAPNIITLEGVISDSPLGFAAVAAISKTIGSAFDSITGEFGGSTETRSQQIYNELVSMLKERKFIEIQTTLGLYENLIFQSIFVDRNKQTSRAVFFTATFLEVFVVSSATAEDVEHGEISGDAESNAWASPQNDGTIATVDLT